MLAELDCVSPSSVTLHVVPVARPLSVNVTDGVAIVNVAVALSKLPSDPVAVTVKAAAVLDVIVTVHSSVPAPLVSPQFVVDNVAPLEIDSVIEIVAVEEVGVNPVPLTVTDVPLGPWLGVSVIAGVVTVNEAFATTVLVEGSDTTTWPLALDGTAIVVPEGMLVPEPVVKECVAVHAVAAPAASKQ